MHTKELKEKLFDEHGRETVPVEMPKGTYQNLSFCETQSRLGFHLGQKSKGTISFFSELFRHGIEDARKKRFNPAELIKESVGNYMEVAPDEYRNKAHIIELELEGGFEIYMNPHYLRYIIINLLHNSFKHGGKELSKIRIKLDGKKRQLTYFDDGVGVPDHAISLIFNAGYSTGGQGLGLYFVKRVLEASRAQVLLTSKQGRASHATFTITFDALDESYMRWDQEQNERNYFS